MTKLRVPSLQHLARNWRNDAQQIKKLLVGVASHPPTFGYEPLFGAARDLLLFGQPYEELREGIRRAISRADLRENYLETLALIRDHFEGVRPEYIQAVDRRFYPVGRGLLVPFTPPLIYGQDSRIHFPWFSFWRSNPLHGEGLSLFVTVVEEMLSQDPDLERSKFQILDFCSPAPKKPRELTVIDVQDIPRVSDSRKREMLDVFVEGYFLADAELAKAPQPSSAEPPVKKPDEPGLFDTLD